MITPRQAIEAAQIVGDDVTRRICPTGLSGATQEQLEQLVKEAVIVNTIAFLEGA